MKEYASIECVVVILTAYIEQMTEKEDEEKRHLLIYTIQYLIKNSYCKQRIMLLKFYSKDLFETIKIIKSLVED